MFDPYDIDIVVMLAASGLELCLHVSKLTYLSLDSHETKCQRDEKWNEYVFSFLFSKPCHVVPVILSSRRVTVDKFPLDLPLKDLVEK
jgi:hypothetical protein